VNALDDYRKTQSKPPPSVILGSAAKNISSSTGHCAKMAKEMSKRSSQEIMRNAVANDTAVPALNIPHLPMMEPAVQALRDTDCFGFIEVARLEWEKFEAESPAAIRETYEKVKDERFTRLHLDHVPVIDEDNLEVDYESIITDAIALGYDSVMIDGSRLTLDENIAVTARVVGLAHAAGIAVEAELGAVLGHEDGPMPPYEELFATGKGFTEPAEAARFVRESDVDWLSVAFGSIHGAVSAAARSNTKVQARLNIEHLERLRAATGIPLVLHGGSGIRKSDVLESFRHGIGKINIATVLRQAYERHHDESVAAAQQAVYALTVELLTEELELAGTASHLNPVT
jgi:ketose-bisphosphate aldolase